MGKARPHQLGSIQASAAELSALTYLREHHVPFVLATEVRLLIVEKAVERGWKPSEG